jgi:hypothetical protein
VHIYLKPTNKSYRTDETYIKVKGEDQYLYRAVDSTGQTIEFLLTAKREAAGAKRFFRKALRSPVNRVPRVINVDKNPAYPAAVEALKAEGSQPRRVHLRQCKYLAMHRGGGNDSERASEVGGQRGPPGTGRLRVGVIRSRRLDCSLIELSALSTTLST